MDPVELLLHPVRLRIVHALSGGRTHSAAELCDQLPDIAKATMYRHVGLLADNGILEVASERRVRGSVERRYRLPEKRPAIDAEAAAAMSLEDHRSGFPAAMAVLLAEFNAYLDRQGADPVADSVSYRQTTLWLNDAELAEMINVVSAALLANTGNPATEDRRPYLLGTIFFPSQ